MPSIRLGTNPIARCPQPPRRSVLAVFIAFTFACIYYFRSSALPTPAPAFHVSYEGQCPPRPPGGQHTPAENGRFKWRDVGEKYPVKNGYTSLSADVPLKLPRIQHAFTALSGAALTERTERQQKVKQVFQRCWSAYRENAWLGDEVGPLSREINSPLNGWGATLVDSLDTLLIMEMYDELNDAINAAVTIDFKPMARSSDQINIFETTIRHLGGFISAYDLTQCTDDRLLDKAIEVADMIYKSFDTPNRMPVTHWDSRGAAAGNDQKAPDSALLAELGTFGLELTRLSQVSGDMRYYDQAVRVAEVFEAQQEKSTLPGIWPIFVNAKEGDWSLGSEYTFGGMADSAFEYLPKMFQLMGGIDHAPQHEKMYRRVMEVALDKLLYRPMLPDQADVLMPTGYHIVNGSSGYADHKTQHLACFVGGMLGLGGRLFDLPDHLEMGRKVTDGCVWAYRHSLLGIMPETIEMLPCESTVACEWDEAKFKAAAEGSAPPGFAAVRDTRYILRPEAIESVFYMYRITGDAKYQDIAWDMFAAIDNYTRTDIANAALSDATVDPPTMMDSMESFWFSETLKYFYLIFSDPSLISLDDFVFNTEAHPFRRPKDD